MEGTVMTEPDEDEGRYIVATENGTIWMHTDDVSAAFQQADEMNRPDGEDRMRRFLPEYEHIAGTAKVYLCDVSGELVEVIEDA